MYAKDDRIMTLHPKFTKHLQRFRYSETPLGELIVSAGFPSSNASFFLFRYATQKQVIGDRSAPRFRRLALITEYDGPVFREER